MFFLINKNYYNIEGESLECLLPWNILKQIIHNFQKINENVEIDFV